MKQQMKKKNMNENIYINVKKTQYIILYLINKANIWVTINAKKNSINLINE